MVSLWTNMNNLNDMFIIIYFLFSILMSFYYLNWMSILEQRPWLFQWKQALW